MTAVPRSGVREYDRYGDRWDRDDGAFLERYYDIVGRELPTRERG